MTRLPWARGPNRVVPLRLGLGPVGFALFLAGCKTAGDLTRDTRDSTPLVYGIRASAVFAAAVAAVGDDFEIVAQDQRLGEIRLRRESYMNGMWVCHGHVMAVFLSPDGDSRTRVKHSRKVSAILVGLRERTSPSSVDLQRAELYAGQSSQAPP